jgi:hypothetical protein
MPGIDYRSPTGRQLTGMQAVSSEVAYYTNKERGEAIADRTIARGVANRVPFGYRRNGTFVDGKLASKLDPDRDGKALVPDPETAPLLRRIFEMRAAGHGWRSIGEWLEDQGAVPPRGGSWSVSTLRNIIANEVYLGVVKLGDRRVEDAHEPLVSRSLWRSAQSSVTVKRNGQNVAGVAGGLLVCANCGRSLSVTGRNPSYTCRRTLGGKCERPVYVSKKRADAFVEEQIINVLRHASFVPLIGSREIDSLREGLTSAKAELEEFVLATKALDREVFQRGVEDRQAKVDRARQALEERQADADTAAELPSPEGWASLDLDHKRQVARAMIESVIVYDAEGRGPNAPVEMRFEIRGRGGLDFG